MIPKIEEHDLHGNGPCDHEVYVMEPKRHRPVVHVLPDGSTVKHEGMLDYWSSVTNVQCPVEGCDQLVVWYEAGYVPGYRVCMAKIDDEHCDPATLKHRFLAAGREDEPCLIRDVELES